MAEENTRKPQLGDRLKAVRPVIASNGVPFLQMRSVGSHSMSGREKEGNKERTGLGISRKEGMLYNVEITNDVHI